MNRNYLLGLAFLAAMVVFLVLPNVNFFEESTKFAKPAGQNMVTVESDGTITLVPVKNIDTAINATVDSLKSELNPVITQNTSGISTNASGISTNASGIAANKRTFDSYIKRGSRVSLAMGPGNSAGFDKNNTNRRFLVGTSDNWRVAYNGSANSGNTNNPPQWIINAA
jgi:hypothetical protein